MVQCFLIIGHPFTINDVKYCLMFMVTRLIKQVTYKFLFGRPSASVHLKVQEQDVNYLVDDQSMTIDFEVEYYSLKHIKMMIPIEMNDYVYDLNMSYMHMLAIVDKMHPIENPML